MYVLADQQLEEFKQVQAELRSVSMPTSEVIPQKAISLLSQYKGKALECIVSYISSHNWNDLAQLSSELDAYLTDHDILEAKQDKYSGVNGEEPFSTGYLCRLQIGELSRGDDSLAVLFGIAIWCGEDDVLAVLRRRGRTWQATMIYESDGYSTIDKALGMMQFNALNNGRLFVVAHIDPWCTSNWREITLKFLEERTDDCRPEILYEDSETVYLGVDEPIFMLTQSRNRDGVCLQFTGEKQRMTGAPEQKAISYSFNKGKITKTVGCQR
jgi:hypothetical protein